MSAWSWPTAATVVLVLAAVVLPTPEVPRAETHYVAGHCFPDTERSDSPTGQQAIVYRWENDVHRLYLRRSALSEPEKVLDFLRSACVHWSPSGEYFAVTDYAGSNVATVDILSTVDIGRHVSVSALLPTRVRELVATSLHGYLEAHSWDRAGLLVRIFGDREREPRQFRLTVQCALIDAAWQCVTLDTAR